MVLEVCRYNESTSNAINIGDLQSPIDYFFFLLSMLLQQKRIDMLNIEKKKQVTLLDFMCE
jgi:hypothetical protein